MPDLSRYKCRGITKWMPFNPVPGFGKKLHDSIHNTTEEVLTYDDEYYLSLDYALSSCSEESKKAAIKYHDGTRYKLATGSITSFGNGKIGIETDDGEFIKLETSKISNLEPL